MASVAPGEKLLNNGNLDSSAKRLRELSLVDTRGGSGLEQSGLKSPLRSVRRRTESLIKLTDGSQEAGVVVLHELRTHGSPLSTLTGKSETDFVDLLLLSNSERSSIVSESRGDRSRGSHNVTLGRKSRSAVGQSVGEVQWVVLVHDLLVSSNVLLESGLVVGRHGE